MGEKAGVIQLGGQDGFKEPGIVRMADAKNGLRKMRAIDAICNANEQKLTMIPNAAFRRLLERAAILEEMPLWTGTLMAWTVGPKNDCKYVEFEDPKDETKYFFPIPNQKAMAAYVAREFEEGIRRRANLWEVIKRKNLMEDKLVYLFSINHGFENGVPTIIPHKDGNKRVVLEIPNRELIQECAIVKADCDYKELHGYHVIYKKGNTAFYDICNDIWAHNNADFLKSCITMVAREMKFQKCEHTGEIKNNNRCPREPYICGKRRGPNPEIAWANKDPWNQYNVLAVDEKQAGLMQFHIDYALDKEKTLKDMADVERRLGPPAQFTICDAANENYYAKRNNAQAPYWEKLRGLPKKYRERYENLMQKLGDVL
jgi:hypothetical protein